MNRRRVARLNRFFWLALVGALVLAACVTAQAAPLAKIIMQGRKQGTSEWLQHLVTNAGDVVEYRLLADMEPIGATNGTNTITSLAGSGLQSLSLAIRQSPAAIHQIDFNIPPAAAQTWRNGWGDGLGASLGELSPRTPGGWNDLIGIRPIQSPGVFSGANAEVILQGGAFTIVSGSHLVREIIKPTWDTGSGAMRINGAGSIFIEPGDQAGADPLVGFEAMSIGPLVPEPSTITLSVMGLAGLIAIVRRSRGSAAFGLAMK
jgi:hypothetical protein